MSFRFWQLLNAQFPIDVIMLSFWLAVDDFPSPFLNINLKLYCSKNLKKLPLNKSNRCLTIELIDSSSLHCFANDLKANAAAFRLSSSLASSWAVIL
jgi:hypothetical protein